MKIRDRFSKFRLPWWGSLLAAVLLIPPLEPLFQVAELSVGLVGCIVGLAFGSMVVIQVLKAIRSMGKK